MCVSCGCGNLPYRGASCDADVREGEEGDLYFGSDSGQGSGTGAGHNRLLKLEADLLGANDRLARRNRAGFEANGIVALNLVSSSGAGKTTLLCTTIEKFARERPALPIAVIEGDQETSFDAVRIRAAGVPAVQVNTGKGCHLDARMVDKAFSSLRRRQAYCGHGGLLFIENVGNLVCPAMWDLGEEAKVAILSVTDGEEKPLKYPDMFATASLLIVNKIDLLPYLHFDVARCIEFARRVNPWIDVIRVSAMTGEGMDAWEAWLMGRLSLKSLETTLP